MPSQLRPTLLVVAAVAAAIAVPAAALPGEPSARVPAAPAASASPPAAAAATAGGAPARDDPGGAPAAVGAQPAPGEVDSPLRLAIARDGTAYRASAPTAGEGLHLFRARVRAAPGGAGGLVRLAVTDGEAEAVVSAPVELAPWWQWAGVTFEASSPVVRVEVVPVVPGARVPPAEVASVSVGQAATTRARAEGRRIVVDGAPYVVRGMTYMPSPPGGTPWTDFWHSNPAQCAADANLMRAGGLNTARLVFLEVNYDEEAYRQCLDAFHANGLRVIWLINPPGGFQWQAVGPVYVEAFWQTVKLAIEELGGHPATMAWNIGNEVNFTEPESNGWFGQLDELARRAKQLDPAHLTTTTLASNQVAGDAAPADFGPGLAPHVDMWGINFYPIGPGRYSDRGWRFVFGRDQSRPAWIGEFGADRLWCAAPDVLSCAEDGTREDGAVKGAWDASTWHDIAAHLSPAHPYGVVGGTAFMWTDLWWFAVAFQGAGTPATHDVSAFQSTQWTRDHFPDGHLAHEWFGYALVQPASATGPRVTTEAYDRYAEALTGVRTVRLGSVRVATAPCSATVRFATDAAAYPRVDFGSLPAPISFAGRRYGDTFVADRSAAAGAAGKSHALELEGLRPSTSYRLHLRAFDQGGRPGTVAPVLVRTPPGSC